MSKTAATVRRFKTYPVYKDSGIGWLGKVPEKWELKRVRTVLRDRDGIKIGPFGSALKSEVMQDSGYKVYGQEHVINGNFQLGDKYVDQSKFDELSACEIEPGDLVVSMMGTTGKCQVVPDNIERGIMDSHLLRIRPKETIHPPLLARLINESEYIRFQISTNSKGSIMEGLNSVIIKNLNLLLPSLDEQRTIAAFLDRETARIDQLIAKKERQIELLQEKRSALISHAVTKGLNPKAKMKDSGIEWLGKIPEHWEVVNLKREIEYITSGSRGWASHYSDEGKIFIRIGNLTRDSIALDLSDVQYVDVPDGSEGERTRVKGGDLLISITAYLGSVAVAPNDLEDAYVSQHVALARPNYKRTTSEWLGYVLLSTIGKTQLDMQGYGGTKIQLGLEDVRSLNITVPPLEEQKHIEKYLAQLMKQADLLSGKIVKSIEVLREYRTALISAAVTGKIDAREEVA